MTDEKKCTKCSKTKSLSEFYNRKGSKDGLEYRCKSCIYEYKRDWKDRNPEKVRAANRSWVRNNPEKNKAKSDRWRASNMEEIAKKAREKLRDDPIHNISNRLRCRTRYALTKVGVKKKQGTTEALLGCTYEELYSHLESLFDEGMSWENKGSWHIDHIIPLCSAKNEEEAINLCHYTNLRPMWAIDNWKKGGKIMEVNDDHV